MPDPTEANIHVPNTLNFIYKSVKPFHLFLYCTSSLYEIRADLVKLLPVNILQHKPERAVNFLIHQPFQPRCPYMKPTVQT